MTLRSGLAAGLAMAFVLLALAPISFAQVNLTVTASPPSPGEIQTNKTAQTAEPGASNGGLLVTGSLVANSTLAATTLIVTYPGPITSSPARCYNSTSTVESACPGGAIPAADPIRIEGQTGLFVTVTQPVLNTAQSRIEIALPASASNTLTGSFRIVGVRIDANGKSGAQSAAISLSNSANNYLLSTSSVPVINTIASGIASMSIGSRSGQTNLGNATIFTNRSVPDRFASFTITEGFASAFRTAQQLSNNTGPVVNSTRIRLTFNNVPTGVTLTLSLNVPNSAAPNNLNANFVATAGGTQTITSSANTAVIDFTSTSLTTVETVEVDTSDITLTSTAAVTSSGSITVTATFFPIGEALDATFNAPTAANGYPVFAQSDVGPVTVVNIVGASTTMLIPLAEKIGGFDTGISVANTTVDPFGGTSGGGAASAAGTLKFDFFPATTAGVGTPCTLTTSSSTRPGFGIAPDGTIPAGGTYAVLLSQLLPLSNCAPGDFIGFIFITANFLNAHGQATITDFRTYSLATNVLVMAPPTTQPRSTPLNGVESLGF